jgi:hypothetical protein
MTVKMDVDYSLSQVSNDKNYLQYGRSGRYQGQGIPRPRDVEETDLYRRTES